MITPKPSPTARIVFLAVAASFVMMGSVLAQTFTFTQCAEVYDTDHGSNRLHVRMNGLHAAIHVNNTGGAAETYTVTLKNVDPDFIFLSQGTTTAKGTNSLTFTWNIGAGTVETVWVNPWYLTPDDFYFIAWGDSQHRPLRFQRLLEKSALINPVLSVAAGDCVKHGDDGGCVGCGARPDVVTDQIYLDYLELFEDYPTPVFEALGNHDITRGGWDTQDDSSYGAGEALWRKYLGATEYGFTVHPSHPSGGVHFLINRFYYDMPNWNSRHYFGGCTPNGFLRFDSNDSVGVAISNFIQSDLNAAQDAAARISVTHHGFNMFISDHNTVANARALYQNGDIDYMIVGHQHTYATGTDGPTQIPYLISGDANGDAHSGNPGFSLFHVSNGQITQQHMLADNLDLNVSYTANGPSLTQGLATVTCSGYNLPFVRLKFRLSNAYASYQAKDVATGANIPAYSRQFSDYTVVYVETSIGNGATKNIQVDPVIPAIFQEEITPENTLIVSPNPTSDDVTIELPVEDNEICDIILYDQSGEEVRRVKSRGKSIVIGRENLDPGVYLIKISTENEYLTTRRLVVK